MALAKPASMQQYCSTSQSALGGCSWMRKCGCSVRRPSRRRRTTAATAATTRPLATSSRSACRGAISCGHARRHGHGRSRVTAGAAGRGRGASAEAANTTPTFTFKEVAAGADDKHYVAEGYDADILIRWGDRCSPARRSWIRAAEQGQPGAPVRLQQRLPRLFSDPGAATRRPRPARASITSTPTRS